MKDPNNFHYAYLTYPIGEWEVDFIIYFYVTPDKEFDAMDITEIEIYSLKKDDMYFDHSDIFTGFASQIIESLLMDKYKDNEKFHEEIYGVCYQAYLERKKF